jgi:hypothetical protein
MLHPNAYAQDWETDIAKATRFFTQDAFEMEIEHLFYPSVTAVVPIERQTVWLHRQGDNFHLRQYGTEVISNDRYTVFIKEDSRVVGIERKEKTPGGGQSSGWESVTQAFTRLATTLGLDTIQPRRQYTCTYLGESGGSKSYRFDYAYGDYEQSTVYLSSKTGLLERVSCIFREAVEVEPGLFRKVRIDFVYKKQQIVQKSDGTRFSVDHILTVSPGGEVELKGKYAEYKLLNHLN